MSGFLYHNGGRWEGRLVCQRKGEISMLADRPATSNGSRDRISRTSASLEPSYVLRALGVEEELAHTSLRIGLGRFTTEQDVDYAVEHIVESVQRLRAMSPLWEMAQEGIDLKSIQWAAH